MKDDKNNIIIIGIYHFVYKRAINMIENSERIFPQLVAESAPKKHMQQRALTAPLRVLKQNSPFEARQTFPYYVISIRHLTSCENLPPIHIII